MTALLDVNVLIALFDPVHIHNEAAHAWFGGPSRGPWATCPLTENGFVRIVANPKYPGNRTTVADAAARLSVFCDSGDHVFWPDSLSIRERERIAAESIRGYRQITDVYLLALATRNDGVLVTFDDSIPVEAVPGANPDRVMTLRPDDRSTPIG